MLAMETKLRATPLCTRNMCKFEFQVTDKKRTLLRDKEGDKGNKNTAPDLNFHSTGKFMSPTLPFLILNASATFMVSVL